MGIPWGAQPGSRGEAPILWLSPASPCCSISVSISHMRRARLRGYDIAQVTQLQMQSWNEGPLTWVLCPTPTLVSVSDGAINTLEKSSCVGLAPWHSRKSCRGHGAHLCHLHGFPESGHSKCWVIRADPGMPSPLKGGPCPFPEKVLNGSLQELTMACRGLTYP